MRYVAIILLLASCTAAKFQLNTCKVAVCPNKDSLIADYVARNPCVQASYNLDSFCKANYSCGPTDTVRTIHTIDGTRDILVPTVDTREVGVLTDSINRQNIVIAGLRGAQTGVWKWLCAIFGVIIIVKLFIK